MPDEKDDHVPKLTPIQTAQDKTRAEIEAMRRTLTVAITAAPEIAKLRRALYLAHMEEGFTKDEALILCQKISL